MPAGLQINRSKGESTSLNNHVNVVQAVLPAIYMRRVGRPCVPACLPRVDALSVCRTTPRPRRPRLIRSNQWTLLSQHTNWHADVQQRSSSQRLRPRRRHSPPLHRHFITGQKNCTEGTRTCMRAGSVQVDYRCSVDGQF